MSRGLRGRLVSLGRWLFGDRPGLVLWLALVCWFGLTWRVGFFIQDTYAMANTVVELTNGQLHVTEPRYSLTFGSQPGLYQHDGRLYGRNYGMLVPAVSLVWALEGLAAVAAPRLVLAGCWAGVGLALAVQLSRFERFDAERTGAVGAVVVALLFVASVLTATELPRERLALVALQLSTILAAATGGLVLYRLVALFHGRRVGLAAGVALGVATPFGFWATLPKRHTLVATLVLATVYAFAVSRHREGSAALRARAGAYALAGYVTWIHAFEALFVVAVLGMVDLATARETGLRELAVVGLVLLVASTPMLATNYAISGNPAQPPRLLPGVSPDFAPEPPAVGDGSATSGGQPQPSLFATARDAVTTVSTFGGRNLVGGVGVLTKPERLWHTFVRSGTIPFVGYGPNNHESIDLTVLEAMPLLGAIAALPVLAWRRAQYATGRSLRDLDPRTWRPARQTDLLVVALAVVMTVVYLPRLPLYSTLTVRYLHPVIPLAAYGVCRLPAVRAGLAESRLLAASFLASLVFAHLVLLGGITGLGLAVGEAVQYNALWNLVAAAVCAVAVVGWTLGDRVPDRAVSVAVAVPAGFTAAYLLLAALVYFRYGSYAFDLVGLVAEALPAL